MTSIQRETSELSKSDLLTTQTESPLFNFARSAAYAAFVQPAEALAQLIDYSASTELQGIARNWSNSAQVEHLNARTAISRFAGQAVGTIATFVVAGKVVGLGTRRGMSQLEVAHKLSQTGLLGLGTKEAALTAFLHDSLLRPTDNKDTRSFAVSRLSNGFVSAVTIGSISSIAGGLAKFGVRSSEPLASELGKNLRMLLCSKPGSTSVAGSLGGGLGVNTDALLKTGTLASATDTTAGMISTGLFAGGLSLIHHMRGTHHYKLIADSECTDSPGRFLIKGPGYTKSRACEVIKSAEQIIQETSLMIRQGEFRTAFALEEHLQREYVQNVLQYPPKMHLLRFTPDGVLTELGTVFSGDAYMQTKHLPYLRRCLSFLNGRTERTMQTVIEGEQVKLVTTKAPVPEIQTRLSWSAPSWSSIAKVDRRMDVLFQEARRLMDAPKTVQTLDTALKTVGEMEWLTGQSWRYIKGTAGVQQLKARSILEAIGVRTGEYRGAIDPNLETLALPLPAFLKKYTGLYAELPSFYKPVKPGAH
ncbi:MAG: hypothetical protein K2W95_16675 [Candidatus Obscuribacterales bacterium]|nr:hypothetical protein [Candidatus Obscuribacterales bacterium]